MDNGGPAFPWSGGERPISDGMSLRDYFAAAALTGILSNPNWNTLQLGMAGITDAGAAPLAARVALVYADALLKAKEVP